MATESRFPLAHEAPPRGQSRWRSWAPWVAALAVFASLAVVGAWLIGLALVYVGGLVAALAIASFVWMALANHHRAGAVSSVGAFARVAVAGVVLLLVVQVLPIGRDHSNPTVTGEPAWSSPRTRELVVAACYSCHSNEVDWPWYSYVAPMSWAIGDHVGEGRAAVNFSEFETNRGEAEESIEEILDGSMPPGYFTRFGLHSEAILSSSEQNELIVGLRATPGFDDDGDGIGHDDEPEHDEEEEEEEEEEEDDGED